MELNSGDIAWVLTSTSLVLFMTAGPGLLLRRHGPVEEHARHADAELLRHGSDRRPLGRGRLQPGLRQPRRTRASSATSTSSASRTSGRPCHPSSPTSPASFIPLDPVRGVPDDVRDHHPGPDHRGHRRPPEVRRVRRVHRHLADRRLRPTGPHGLRRRLAGEHGCARLRRRRGRPHERRCRGAGRRAHHRQAQGLARRADASPQPAVDPHRHGHPVVRLGRVQRRLRPRRQRRRRPGAPQHLRRRLGRDARLAPRRAPEGRARHHPRRRLRCRRRSGRHHAVRRLRRLDAGDHHRLRRRRRLLPGPRPEEGVPVRRRARRDRRAPHRRPARHPHARPVRRPEGERARLQPRAVHHRRRWRAAEGPGGGRGRDARRTPSS